MVGLVTDPCSLLSLSFAFALLLLGITAIITFSGLFKPLAPFVISGDEACEVLELLPFIIHSAATQR